MTIREKYTKKISKMFLVALGLHWPIFIWLSWGNQQTGPLITLMMSLFLIAPALLLYWVGSATSWIPSLIAAASIGHSAILIHLTGGMIESHFHIFVVIAALAAYGLWMPIVAGVLVTATHHLGFFFFLPKSVFNYEATLGIVILHAFYVIVETIPVLLIATQIRRMIATQDSTLGHLAEMSTEIKDSIETISSSGAVLSDRSARSADSLQQTSGSIEQLISLVNRNTESAKMAAELSQDSQQAAMTGNQQFALLIETMEKVSESSKKIEEIINVIDDIAFQTNLLALNAAVEAARAGDQGKGFAVVADAVRTLAQRSADSAKGIQTLINESGQIVKEGSLVAKRSEEAIQKIVEKIEKVAALNSEISEGSIRQSQGINEISRAVLDLDKASQENAEASREIAQKSDSIRSKSAELTALVNQVSQDLGVNEKAS